MLHILAVILSVMTSLFSEDSLNAQGPCVLLSFISAVLAVTEGKLKKREVSMCPLFPCSGAEQVLLDEQYGVILDAQGIGLSS